MYVLEMTSSEKEKEKRFSFYKLWESARMCGDPRAYFRGSWLVQIQLDETDEI